MRRVSVLFAILVSHGCASNASTTAEAPAVSTGGDQAAAAAAADSNETPSQSAKVEAGPVAEANPGPLPESLDAGTIARGDLEGVLAEGIGRFLQKVSMQAHRPQGRFEGWMLQSVFTQHPSWRQGCVLREGDVVLRVNNQSVERPEQFAAVWQSLSSAGEIAIDVVRDGHGSRVRYLIVD